MLTSLAGPEDEERKSYLKWLGRDFDPEFFDLHELQNRVNDFQRVIGEARWGFYHKSRRATSYSLEQRSGESRNRFMNIQMCYGKASLLCKDGHRI